MNLYYFVVYLRPGALPDVRALRRVARLAVRGGLSDLR